MIHLNLRQVTQSKDAMAVKLLNQGEALLQCKFNHKIYDLIF